MKRILTFIAAAMVIILWPASACGQSSVQAEFTPIVEQRLEARSQPAKITGEEESALTSKGYVEIGTIKASQQGKKTNAEVTKLLATAILTKAAEVGGDVVRFSEQGVVVTTEVPTGKTRTERGCVKFGYVSMSVGCSNFEHCSIKYVPVWQCVEWGDAKEVAITKKEQGLVSEGTVWRYDPGQSARLLTEAARINNFLEFVKNGDLTAISAALIDDPELITITDHDGWTALHMAALNGRKEVAELLLAKGANVNAKDVFHDTPLHLAARSHRTLEVAELLLAKGADVNAKNYWGATPLHVAVEEGHSDVAELLRQHGGHE